MKVQTTTFLLVRRIAADKRLRKIHAISFFTHAFKKSNTLSTNRLYTLSQKILFLIPFSFVKHSDSPLIHFLQIIRKYLISRTITHSNTDSDKETKITTPRNAARNQITDS